MTRCKLLIAVILSFVLTLSSAHADVIILTSRSQYALEVANKIQLGIKAPSEIKHSIDHVKDTDIVVALGNEALAEAERKASKKIVASFIGYSGRNNKNIKTIIYAEPSPETLAHFFDVNFNKARIGILYSPKDREYIERINSSLKTGNNELIPIVSTGDTFVEINKLIRMDIDLLFIRNDDAIYKPGNIRFVLETLFRKRIPVITNTKSLLKAGATAAITPDEELIIRETIEAINLLSSGKVNSIPYRFIETAKTDTNKSMIKILNVKIKEDN